MRDFPDERIRQALEPFGVAVNAALAGRVRRYAELLLRWNRRVNLTSITEPDEILRRHFGESFFAAYAVPIERGRLIDVGTGAGFPGLALRALLDDLRVTLVEPTTRKSVFLAEVCRELDFIDVEIFRGTMADFGNARGQFDYVTARALGRHRDVLAFAMGLLRPGGKIVLWVGMQDVGEIRRDLSWSWRDPISIPLSEQRCLLVGQTLSKS